MMSAGSYLLLVFKLIFVHLGTDTLAGLFNRQQFNENNVVEYVTVKIVGFKHTGALKYYIETSSSRHRYSVTF